MVLSWWIRAAQFFELGVLCIQTCVELKQPPMTAVFLLDSDLHLICAWLTGALRRPWFVNRPTVQFNNKPRVLISR